MYDWTNTTLETNTHGFLYFNFMYNPPPPPLPYFEILTGAYNKNINPDPSYGNF